MNISKLKKVKILLITALCLYPFYTFSSIVPYIVETKTLHFGNIIFIPGSCLMAYDTQVITNLTPHNICASNSGTSGGYRVFANPNKQVQITIKSHGDIGNGIIYVPDGQIVSDFESALIIADTTKTINSGTTGIIDITIGGRLTINSTLASSSNYNELFEVEFIEL